MKFRAATMEDKLKDVFLVYGMEIDKKLLLPKELEDFVFYLNDKRYIGITKRTTVERWGSNGQRYKRSNPYFYNAIEKYGWDGFSHEVVESGLDYETAASLEVDLILEYLHHFLVHRHPLFGMPMVQGSRIFHFPLQGEAFAIRLLMAQNLSEACILQLAVLLHFGDIAFSQPDYKVSGIIHINLIGSIVYQHCLLRLFTLHKDRKKNKIGYTKERNFCIA